MKTVYLLLTRSSTLFSCLIRIITGAAYTHVSISTVCPPASEDISGFYSFGRKHPLLWFPAGFIREDRENGYFQFFPNTACTLLELDIPDTAYHQICSRLRQMTNCPQRYRYHLAGALFCGIGIPLERNRRYFCSQFVGELLAQSHAVCLPKPAVLMHPVDYAALPGVRIVYTGTVGALFESLRPRPLIKIPGILAILPKLCYTEYRTKK